jgi:hypothetical protein
MSTILNYVADRIIPKAKARPGSLVDSAKSCLGIYPREKNDVRIVVAAVLSKTNLEITDAEDVIANYALEASGAVLDLELGSVLLVRLGRLTVVFGVKEAGDRSTPGGRHPEIGRLQHKLSVYYAQ